MGESCSNLDMGAMTVYRIQYILPLIRVDSHVVDKQRRLVEKFAVLEYYTVRYIQYSMYNVQCTMYMRDEFNKINL